MLKRNKKFDRNNFAMYPFNAMRYTNTPKNLSFIWRCYLVGLGANLAGLYARVVFLMANKARLFFPSSLHNIQTKSTHSIAGRKFDKSSVSGLSPAVFVSGELSSLELELVRLEAMNKALRKRLRDIQILEDCEENEEENEYPEHPDTYARSGKNAWE